MERTPRTRGPYRSGIRRRAEILSHAIDVFGRYGYSAGSLQEIAQRAGITPAAIMRHFNDKEELFVEVLRHWDRDQIELDTTQSTGLAFFRGLHQVSRYNMAHRGFIDLYLTLSIEASHPDHPGHPFVVERYRRTVADFKAHIGHAIDKGEIPPMTEAKVQYEAQMLIAIFDGFAIQWMLDETIDLVQLIGTYLERAIERWQNGGGLEADPAMKRAKVA